uniref:Basal cell adhesion molecule n=1 Tax=Mus musculus TaxID=10090 RepID=D6RE44_MOUSE
MEPPDARAGLLWLTFLLSGYSGPSLTSAQVTHLTLFKLLWCPG